MHQALKKYVNYSKKMYQLLKIDVYFSLKNIKLNIYLSVETPRWHTFGYNPRKFLWKLKNS